MAWTKDALRRALPKAQTSEDEDQLVQTLATIMLGQSPAAAEMGVKHPMDPSYMTGATGMSQEESIFEPTLAPGEWEQMTAERQRLRAMGQLLGIVQSAGVENIPSIGPHGPRPVVPGSRSRPVPPSQDPFILDAVLGKTPSLEALALAEQKRNPPTRPSDAHLSLEDRLAVTSFDPKRIDSASPEAQKHQKDVENWREEYKKWRQEQLGGTRVNYLGKTLTATGREVKSRGYPALEFVDADGKTKVIPINDLGSFGKLVD